MVMVVALVHLSLAHCEATAFITWFSCLGAGLFAGLHDLRRLEQFSVILLILGHNFIVARLELFCGHSVVVVVALVHFGLAHREAAALITWLTGLEASVFARLHNLPSRVELRTHGPTQEAGGRTLVGLVLGNDLVTTLLKLGSGNGVVVVMAHIHLSLALSPAAAVLAPCPGFFASLVTRFHDLLHPVELHGPRLVNSTGTKPEKGLRRLLPYNDGKRLCADEGQ